MEFGTLIPLFYLSLCICATFPIISGTMIFIMARDKSRKPLAMAILLSGITFATIATVPQLLISFSDRGNSNILAGLLGNSIYFILAFGIGSLTATVIGVPGSFVLSRTSTWIKSRKDGNMTGLEETK